MHLGTLKVRRVRLHCLTLTDGSRGRITPPMDTVRRPVAAALNLPLFIRNLQLALCVVHFSFGVAASAETFRVATYNLENYLAGASQTRPAKSVESRAKVRASIRALKPDVLAVQEIGGTNALLELRDSLKAEGLDLPFWEHIPAFDTNIQVAVLSRFPFTARRPHTNENFLLSGRRYQVSRGFAEVDVQVNTNYAFTLFAAHLKSKRAVGMADDAELRLEEARLLRDKIDARLAANPQANFMVLGDFNDTKESASTKAILGRGKHKLVDTRPAERNGDQACVSKPADEPRDVAWTYYYSHADTYTRIDFILLSPGMAREWVTNETYVLTLPGWGVASDHRPIVATFEAADR
jgi:endonuclease/exonuclease/phosphatase family metal-dependent hydrolase